MSAYRHVRVPSEGERIDVGTDGVWRVPDRPIIPFIEGDGTGPDIWRASQRVFDAAVEQGVRRSPQGRLDGDLRRREVARALRQGRVAARGDQRGHPRLQDRDQGPAHDAGRRRHPQHQRHAPPGARPLRVRPSGALVPGRPESREGAAEARRRHLSREHRGRLRRHRVQGGHARSRRAHRVHPHALEEGDSRRAPGIGIKPMSAFGSQASGARARSPTPSRRGSRASPWCTRATS